MLTSVPVPVEIAFKRAIKPDKFVARLNDKNVSGRFDVDATSAIASLTEDDGVRISDEHRRRKNVLDIWVKTSGRPSRTHHARRVFFVEPDDGTIPPVSGVISPTGGSLELPGVGSVTFPAGAFSADTPVGLSVSQAPETQRLFDDTAVPIFAVTNRLTYEIRVTTGNVQPLVDPQLTLALPDAFRVGVPAGSEVRLLAVNHWEGPLDTLDTLELLEDRFAPTASDVTATIPRYHFTAGLRTDGVVELTALAATTPTAPPAPPAPPANSVQSAPAEEVPAEQLTEAEPPTEEAAEEPRMLMLRGAPLQAAADCQGSSLAPPLDGDLEVTSEFGPRVHPITGQQSFHRGTDLDAANGSTVRSMADGVVEKVTTQTNAQGQVTGWGNYVVVKHTDGSRTLYAHLQSGTAVAQGTQLTSGDRIASSDNSGSSSGPHLHVEYAPNGQIYNNSSKVDPRPCIGSTVTGSITVRDNGPLADDAFSVAIDGLVVCTTAIGASNTCAVGNLRPGTKTLTLTAVIAPDDAGTFEITLGSGLTFAGGGTQQSGTIPEGVTSSYSIIVPPPS